MDDSNRDLRTYAVVVNHEEQYSIWPVDKEIPVGWKATGVSGGKAECLEYIEKVWPDIRPLSVRRKISDKRPA